MRQQTLYVVIDTPGFIVFVRLPLLPLPGHDSHALQARSVSGGTLDRGASCQAISNSIGNDRIAASAETSGPVKVNQGSWSSV